MQAAPVTLYELTDRIRDLATGPLLQTSLLKDRSAWLTLCSALDTIGDTDLALDAYTAESFPSTPGALYVLVYGILQVLYVQQNAASDLLAALGIAVRHEDYPRLARIRDIRSGSVGHPTKKKTKGGFTHHFITRVSLSKNGFMLLSYRRDGSIQWEHVAIPGLIAQQREDMTNILGKVIKGLETREDRHREKFKDEKLEALLPHTLSYHFQKIGEATAGTTGPVGAALGLASVTAMREALGRLREALTRRGLDEAPHLSGSIEEVLYPLNEVEAFFKAVCQGAQPKINEKLAYICAFFIDKRIDGLRQTAREIDKEYARSARKPKGAPPA
jgi:hypothetical protein